MALALFVVRGFESTTMDDIAAALGSVAERSSTTTPLRTILCGESSTKSSSGFASTCTPSSKTVRSSRLFETPQCVPTPTRARHSTSCTCD